MANNFPDESNAVHREFAVELFNHVWDLMEKENRTPAEDQEMIHAAHASRYHWGVVGQPVNWARGEWQISRVYALLELGDASLRHAEYCLQWCKNGQVGAFDLAFAHEALARAYNSIGDVNMKSHHLEQANRFGEQIEDQEDRLWLQENLSTI